MSEGEARETRVWLVSGRVQGVAFRAAARRRARELGLGGLAENLPDGRVRVVGIGAAGALDRFAEWLGQGPRYARVDALESVPETRAAEAVRAARAGDGDFLTR